MKLNRFDASTHPPSGERLAGSANASAARIPAVEALKAAENDGHSPSGDENAKHPMAALSEPDVALANAQHLAEQLAGLGKAADALIQPAALHDPSLHVLDDSA